jgi:hypothetical protein
MEITNWERLDGTPEKISRETYRLQEMERIGLTAEWFDRLLAVIPCDCGKELEWGGRCQGWATTYRGEARRLERETRKRKRAAERECVYFARLGGLIKIGFSKDPDRRAKDLNAELLGFCVGDRDLERALHEEFAKTRVRGEWFREHPALLERIEALTL